MLVPGAIRYYHKLISNTEKLVYTMQTTTPNQPPFNHAQWQTRGFSLISDVFDHGQVQAIAGCIQQADQSGGNFRKSGELFAVRQLLKEIPALQPLLFTDKLKAIVREAGTPGHFLVKSIYFDKPPGSNWYVSRHQDLTLSVDRKADLPGFGPWTVKQGLFAVQAPLSYLHNILTLRIHLDETDETNGALKVLPGSHLGGITRPEDLTDAVEKEVYCPVPAGGVMLMKPLLFHRSERSTGLCRRRVIHLEFCSLELPVPLQWPEKLSLA